jgi:hypothetical protein
LNTGVTFGRLLDSASGPESITEEHRSTGMKILCETLHKPDLTSYECPGRGELSNSRPCRYSCDLPSFLPYTTNSNWRSRRPLRLPFCHRLRYFYVVVPTCLSVQACHKYCFQTLNYDPAVYSSWVTLFTISFIPRRAPLSAIQRTFKSFIQQTRLRKSVSEEHLRLQLPNHKVDSHK